MPKPVIFLGPSLELSVAREILDANYLPPIKRGDLAKLDRAVETVGIVDGEFFQSLAVSPKEVLVLMDRGVKVFGSSSMGALRAAELHILGMVGVGRVFELYRDGIIEADDEVALLYDPVTYRACSEPLVNLRCALNLAVQRNVVGRLKADEILSRLMEIYFPYRTHWTVKLLCPELEDFMRSLPSNQKRDDALLLLKTIAAGEA
jgi:hypothetical protein